MPKYKIFDVSLFVASIIVGLSFAPIEVDLIKFLIVISIYLIFSAIYSNIKIQQGNGRGSFDYGISYSQSFTLFAGPFGLFIFEFIHRFNVYLQRKYTKTADADEFTDTLYNIGSFVLYNTLGYLIFFAFYPFAQTIPFGYFLLFFVVTVINSWNAHGLMAFSFYLIGNINSWSEVWAFLKNRTLFDNGKVAITNALLYYFVMESQWEMLIGMFLLNYVVSKSFVSRQEKAQNELERDRFREMAYTDFMTGLSNRAMMDKQMEEINGTDEVLGIVVADIDKFKQINDNYNHAVGDKVIQHFADILKSHTSKDDCVFRSGGEEFTIFLRDRNYLECLEFLKSVSTYVNAHPVEVEYDGNETSIVYSASFGLYFNKMTEELPMERAYIYADQLLLKAKEQGRNRHVVKNGERSSVYA